MNRQRISFVLGERLKALREERDLSHDKLIKQLNEKYGITVSRDSLMAYEIADESRAKASKLPNMGMRVEYLYCLSDFYGVSIDYLLGKTEKKNIDIDVRGICEKTGLSEETIELLIANQSHTKSSTGQHFMPMNGINCVLKGWVFGEFIELLSDYVNTVNKASVVIREAKQGILSCKNNHVKSLYSDNMEKKILHMLKNVRYGRLNIIDYMTDILILYQTEQNVNDKAYDLFLDEPE